MLQIPDLTGKVIVVTGGNAGLGYETVRRLAKHNPARLYLAARSKDKAEKAIEQLRAENPNAAPTIFLPLNLASFASIKNAASTLQNSETRLDILINNAGIMMTAEGLTEDGYETQFGTNHMGHALFTELLLPLLRTTAKLNPQTRVVSLASASERRLSTPLWSLGSLKTTCSELQTTQRYIVSKIANIQYSAAQARRGEGVKFICVHPGMVKTDLHHDSSGLLLRAFLYTAISLFATPVETGAESQIWAAVSPEAESGKFYGPVGVAESGAKETARLDLGETIWDWTQKELEAHLP